MKVFVAFLARYGMNQPRTDTSLLEEGQTWQHLVFIRHLGLMGEVLLPSYKARGPPHPPLYTWHSLFFIFNNWLRSFFWLMKRNFFVMKNKAIKWYQMLFGQGGRHICTICVMLIKSYIHAVEMEFKVVLHRSLPRSKQRAPSILTPVVIFNDAHLEALSWNQIVK